MRCRRSRPLPHRLQAPLRVLRLGQYRRNRSGLAAPRGAEDFPSRRDDVPCRSILLNPWDSSPIRALAADVVADDFAVRNNGVRAAYPSELGYIADLAVGACALRPYLRGIAGRGLDPTPLAGGDGDGLGATVDRTAAGRPLRTQCCRRGCGLLLTRRRRVSPRRLRRRLVRVSTDPSETCAWVARGGVRDG